MGTTTAIKASRREIRKAFGPEALEVIAHLDVRLEQVERGLHAAADVRLEQVERGLHACRAADVPALHAHVNDIRSRLHAADETARALAFRVRVYAVLGAATAAALAALALGVAP